MPINKPQGLRGLKGLNTLSPEERNAFMKSHASILNKYDDLDQRDQAANILYMNQKYVNTFGLDDFNLNNDGTEESFNMRNEKTKFKVVTDVFKNRLGKESNFNELASFLDIDGMYDLLTNQEYLGNREISRRLAENIKSSKVRQNTYDKSWSIPHPESALGMGLIRTQTVMDPYKQQKKDLARDKEILDRLKNESRERREEVVQGDADMLYANMLMADDTGKQSLAKTLNEFNKVASTSQYYNTYKNSKWMRDYSAEDRLKDYSKYLALKSRYGEAIARQYLEINMQNKVAKAQDGRFTGNTLKGVLTTAWSDIGSNVALFANAGSWLNTDRMAILNQGKDPDKPIYDKKGNIIDYKENTNIWTNPAYWNNVYKYNTFSPTEIKAIQERGGVSEDVNVRAYGYTPDFLSWDTVEEGFKQSGHVLAGITETALTGGFGKAIGWGSKAALKGIGLSTKAMQSASKWGTITNDMFVGLTTGLEGAQLEAMGTFDEQMESAKEKINAEIGRELSEYQQSINYNSKEAIAGINAFYNQLKAKDVRRVALGNREGASAFPLSDATLKAQAKQLYTNQLLGIKQKELQELHKKDELEAAKVAAKAYGTNFIMDYIKNIPITTGIQKFKIAKGAMREAFDETINKNIIADAESGGVSRIVDKAGNTVKYSSGKKLGKELLKQLGGGFADEYLDGINASFAGGVGNNMFDNYIKKNYDPKAYDSTVDSFLGNMLVGFSEGIDGLTDRQNLYEGFIGMISPVATITVNPNAAYHPRDVWKAVVNDGEDSYSNKINMVERASSILMNPLLNAYADAREKDRALDRTVEAINSVVSANKDKINDAANIISVLNNYDGSIAVQNPFSVLDYKDNKLYNSFTLINALNSLENMDGGVNSKLYKDTMYTIQGLADGTLSQEELDNEIDMVLGDKDNKSILEDKNAREEAANRLQKNAKYFMDMKDKMTEIQNIFTKSPNLMKEDPTVLNILMYNLVATDDYQKRLRSIEDELGLSHTDTDSMFTPDYNIRYGTDQAKKIAIAAREREINKVQKEIDRLNNSNSYIEKKIKVLERQNVANYTDSTIEDNIKKQKKLLESQKFMLETLEKEKKKFTEEKEEINKIETNKGITKTFFTKEDLLHYDVRDIAYVLDDNNRSNFSEGRQAVIDYIKSSLEQKDPEAMKKIADASTLATRIEDAKTAYNRIMNNKELASTYFDVVSRVRERDAIAESVQRQIKEYYGKLENAYTNRNNEPELFKNTILQTNTDLMDAYMEDYPNQVNEIKPYYDMLKFDEDAAAIIRTSDYSEDERLAMMDKIFALEKTSDTREELETKIEELIDSEDLELESRNRYEYLLSTMEKLGHQRNASIVEARKERLQREEEERKKKKEEKKKVEDEAKEAAEKKTNENIPTEEGLNKNSIEDVSFDFSEEKESEDNENGKSINNNTSSQIVNEEDLHQTDNSVLNTGSLMKDNFGNGSIDMGDMWYGTADNPKKGKLLVTKEDNNITFKVDGKDTSIEITPDEYETVTDEQENKKNSSFIANSMEKKDGDWYFNGTFAGDKEETQVKVKKDFNIDQAIERQQAANEADLAAKDIIADSNNLIDNGDTFQATSETINEQAEDTSNEKVQISDINEDVKEQNTIGLKNMETNATTLGGNAMSRYEPRPLAEDGILINKKGAEINDTMNQYYAWMNAAGVKLQNIIDHELAKIIRRTPNAKVKFMAVKPERNATNDVAMQSHLMLVLDYDNSINKGITAIHDDANGGVIESNGKKYLIIGTAGYGDMNLAKRNLYDIIWNPYLPEGFRLKVERKKFFDTNPEERFYVNEDLSTEIVPYSLIPGYIVRQLTTDEHPEYRSIKDILADKERNPMGYNMNTLSWGIQEKSQFLLINTNIKDVMVPRNPMNNLGSTFVLMPASNGKMVPSYLKVLKYNEMNDGALKGRINSLLQRMINPDYKTRVNAVIELSKIFYFDKDGNNILIGKDESKHKNEISLAHGDDILHTFVLDNNFDMTKFMQAFEDFNPRINITASVLQNVATLMEYDEAGALMTDAALFGTVGSSYSIYGLDIDGKMIMPEQPVNEIPKVSNSDFKDSRQQIIFNREYYRWADDNFYLDGKIVTAEKKINQLNYIKNILDNQLSPVQSKGVLDYYILSTGENPNVISVNRNSKKVKELQKEQALELIKKIEEMKAKQQREQKAQEEIKASIKNIPMANDGDVDLGIDSYIDPNTGEITPIIEENTEVIDSTSSKDVVVDEVPIQENKVPNITKVIKVKPEGTQSFADLYTNRGYNRRIMKLVRNKWKDAPKKIADLEKFLRDKDVEVNAIGTSENDVEAWIRTIEDCR